MTLSGSDETVELSSLDGIAVVSIHVPGILSQGGEGTLEVQFARDSSLTTNDDSPLRSAVIDITLVVEGQIVTELSEPMEICIELPVSGEAPSDLCLAYFDVTSNTWLCEDLSLASNGQGQLCGVTGHLTSFALLLGSGDGSSYFFNSSIAWVSLGFLIGSILIVVFAIGVIEIHYIRRRRISHAQFSALETRMLKTQD